MKTKHTKGEWGIRFKRRIGYNASHTIIYADKEGIAEIICEFDGQNKQIEANAKLIAAAPELLKGLMEIKKSLEGDVSERVIDNCIVRAEQVINKAIG